jgi:hypothetical protein
MRIPGASVGFALQMYELSGIMLRSDIEHGGAHSLYKSKATRGHVCTSSRSGARLIHHSET